MKVGYARVSTTDQDASFDHQIYALQEAGCEKVFSEKVSATTTNRPEFNDMLEWVREGDTVVVTRLDRFARSSRDLANTLDLLKQKGVGFECLSPQLRSEGPMGEFMLSIFGAVAQLEVDLMKERQKIGIAKAKADGKYQGRKPTARSKKDEIRSLIASGMTKSEVAKQLKISERSVYRHVA